MQLRQRQGVRPARAGSWGGARRPTLDQTVCAAANSTAPTRACRGGACPACRPCAGIFTGQTLRDTVGKTRPLPADLRRSHRRLVLPREGRPAEIRIGDSLVMVTPARRRASGTSSRLSSMSTLPTPMRPTGRRWRRAPKRLKPRWTRHTATGVPWCVIPSAMSSRSRTGWPRLTPSIRQSHRLGGRAYSRRRMDQTHPDHGSAIRSCWTQLAHQPAPTATLMRRRMFAS